MKKVLSVMLVLLITIGSFSFSVSAKKKVKATSIKLSKKTLTMKKGDKKTLKCTLKPKNVTVKKVKWTSSNTKIATVSAKGKVTAKKSGIVKITAKTTDGSKLKANCTITVLNKTVKKAVKNNLIALRDYILEYGEENRVGQLAIWGSYKYDDDVSECNYNIKYIPKTKCFEFYWNDDVYSELEDYETSTIFTMEYALTGFDYCTVKLNEVKYEYEDPVASCTADITLPTATYNRDGKKPDIKITSNTYSTSDSKLKDLLNSDFKIAMTDWDYLLKEYLAFGFADIGFTDF